MRGGEREYNDMMDVDLTPHDIQGLNGPDAVSAFFARLGYNTATRTLQEDLDFVLLEKYLSGDQKDASGIVLKQVNIRPRILTIERRKPSRVHLRVLRRFTWTESDPFAQYDKLLSAYAVADWSEEFFNNRALFSDYYLLERLPEFSAWAEDPKPAFLGLRELYLGASSRFAGKKNVFLQKGLLEGVLKVLGYEFRPGNKSGAPVEPDYQLFSHHEAQLPIGLCLTYPWGRSLDGKDDRRDKKTSEENTGAVVVTAGFGVRSTLFTEVLY